MDAGGGSGGDRDAEAEGAPPIRAHPPTAEDPDFPPESIQVPIGEDGVDWTYLNAVFDRDDSTKGSTNPKCTHSNPKSRSISELSSASLKAKPPVIGLPNSIRASGRASRRPTAGRIFPRKGARSGGASAAEPGSPKVSCFGKVLSDRERKRGGKEGARGRRQRRWLCSLGGMFRRGGGGGGGGDRGGEGRGGGSPPSPESACRAPSLAVPGLGGMKRFASGRRTASWGEEEAAGEGQLRRGNPERMEAEEGQLGRRYPVRAEEEEEDKTGGVG